MLSLFPPLLTLLFAASATAAVCYWLFRRKTRGLRQTAEVLIGENREMADLLDMDPLTSCYSRRFFVKRAQSKLNNLTGHGMSLMIVDIDSFKSLNDSYGHGAGDSFLRQTADLIRTQIGDQGFVARLGGDEFWIALPDLSPQDARHLADRLSKLIGNQRSQANGTEISRTASIGVTFVAPGTALDQAMLEADGALYLAKASGRNSAVLADSGLRKRLADAVAKPTVEGIRDGLNRDEFTFFVQPIFDIATRKPLGVEALIRWVRSDGSILLPADFMSTISRHYTRAATPPIRLAAEVSKAFANHDPSLFCAFNVSTASLNQPLSEGLDWFNRLLDGFSPAQSVIEVVESAMIEDLPQARALLDALHEQGVRIALDDFGTGHSNLQRLGELPVDIVKVDRSLVVSLPVSPRHRAILRALVALGTDLGFDIIAEGVETADQLAVLQDLGVGAAQGFFLGAPAQLDNWKRKLDLKVIAAE